MTFNKPKVLYIAKNIPVPGMYSSRIILEIAHNLSRFYDISFLFPKELVPPGMHYLPKYKPLYGLKSWNSEGYDITIYPYPRLPFRNFSFSLWNKLSQKGENYFKNNGPFQLIHAHYLMPDGYLAYLFSKAYQIPYLITIRNADIKLLKGISKNQTDFRKTELVVKNAGKVLTLNGAYKAFIDDFFGIRSEIIPHGIAEKVYSDEKTVNDGIIRISTIAEAIPRKNIDWVIRAVKNYDGNKRIQLTVIGDGPLSDSLQRLAGNDKRIVFTGRLNHEETLMRLRESDIFALPSSDESFGMVYLEAAATLNAIIGRMHEGVWGVFEDRKEMIFSTDEQNFADLLHSCIDKAELRALLASNALKKAKALSWESIVSRYTQLYDRIIKENSN